MISHRQLMQIGGARFSGRNLSARGALRRSRIIMRDTPNMIRREMKYKFKNSALEKMKAHLTEEYPKEGCGILAGDSNGSIEAIFCMGNISDHKRSAGHYEMDPLEVYEIEKKMQEKGYSILGFYHSHPDQEARMSSEDSEHMIPQMLYVIASVNNGKCGEIRGYVKDL